MNIFLPNSHARFKYRGKEFTSVTAALCAERNWDYADEFVTLLPSEAEDLSKTLPEPDNWDWDKDHFKYKITLAKFEQNPLLLKQLLSFDYEEINDEEEQTIIRLVQQTLKRKYNIDKLTKEQERLMEFYSQNDTPLA